MDNDDIHELLELTEEAVGYVPPYFRQKWDMDKRLAIIESRLAPASRPSDAAGAAALIVCPRCSAGDDANPFSSEGLVPWHADPRADLLRRGEEEDE